MTSIYLGAMAMIASACGPRPMVSDRHGAEPAADAAPPTATFDYRKYIDSVYNAHNPDAVDQFFVSDVVVHSIAPDAGGGEGTDYVKDVVRVLTEAFPDLRLTVEDVVQDGDRLAARVTVEGTHKKTFAGIAPTGRKVKVTNFAIYRLKDGRIAEMWSLVDLHQLRRQLTEPR